MYPIRRASITCPVTVFLAIAIAAAPLHAQQQARPLDTPSAGVLRSVRPLVLGPSAGVAQVGAASRRAIEVTTPADDGITRTSAVPADSAPGDAGHGFAFSRGGNTALGALLGGILGGLVGHGKGCNPGTCGTSTADENRNVSTAIGVLIGLAGGAVIGALLPAE